MRSGDIETKPSPEALSFCCWNLNRITAYDFVGVSLVEAYNSLCNTDIIGIAETHLDSIADEDRLALVGNSFYKANSPQNAKRGGVGLYAKDSIPCKHRLYLANLPDCIMSEIHLNKKSTFML